VKERSAPIGLPAHKKLPPMPVLKKHVAELSQIICKFVSYASDTKETFCSLHVQYTEKNMLNNWPIVVTLAAEACPSLPKQV